MQKQLNKKKVSFSKTNGVGTTRHPFEEKGGQKRGGAKKETEQNHDLR